MEGTLVQRPSVSNQLQNRALPEGREQEENEKDILFPPEKAFYLVGFDQRQSREKLYKAIKKYCWVIKFDLPRSQKKGCQNKGYAFVHTCSKDIVDSIVSQSQITVLNRICAVDYFVSRKHRDPNAVSVKPPEQNIINATLNKPRPPRNSKPRDHSSIPHNAGHIHNTNSKIGHPQGAHHGVISTEQKMPNSNNRYKRDTLIEAQYPNFMHNMKTVPNLGNNYTPVMLKDVGPLQHTTQPGTSQAIYYAQNCQTQNSSIGKNYYQNYPPPPDNTVYNLGCYPFNQSGAYQVNCVNLPNANYEYNGQGQNNNNK